MYVLLMFNRNTEAWEPIEPTFGIGRGEWLEIQVAEAVTPGSVIAYL